MIALLWPLIRPFIGYIIGVVALLGAVSGFYFKAKHDGVVAENAKIERQKEDAIAKANKAREHVSVLCSTRAVGNCPADWFRD